MTLIRGPLMIRDEIPAAEDLLVDVVLEGASLTDVRLAVFEVGCEVDSYLEDLLVEAAAKTPREKAFEISIRRHLRDVRKQSSGLLARARSHIRDYEREVLDLIDSSELTDYGAHRLASVKSELASARARLDARLSGEWISAATEASALAIAGIDGPVREIFGFPLPGFSMSEDHLSLLMGQAPSLITGVTSEVHKKVQTILTQKMLGGLSVRQAKERLGSLTGSLPRLAGRETLPGKVFSGTYIRTETIFRTEFNRVYNTVHTGRIDDVAAKIPGIGKVWIHNPTASRTPRSRHAALNGKIVFPGEGEKFELAGYKVDGPYDPALPAEEVINCHCRVRVAYSDEVAAEQERRKGLKSPAPSKKAPSKKASPRPPSKAKRLRAIEERAEREGLAKKVKLGRKIDPDKAERMIDELSRLKAEAGIEDVVLDVIEPLRLNTRNNQATYMQVSERINARTDKVIETAFRFNANAVSKSDLFIEQCKKTELLLNVDQMEDLIKHEFGHVVDLLNRKNLHETGSTKLWQELIRREGDIHGINRAKDALAKASGSYATGDVGELFAEVYRLYKTDRLPDSWGWAGEWLKTLSFVT